MSSYRDEKNDREKHNEEIASYYDGDAEYRRKGSKGREWKNHKYIKKEKSPAGYMRYYYEVPSEIEGRSNVVGYYEDSPQNRRAMKYGGDKRRELSNKELKDIEEDKRGFEKATWYLEDLPKDVFELDVDDIKYDLSGAKEHVDDAISAYGKEAVANLTGVKNDIKGFFDELFK